MEIEVLTMERYDDRGKIIIYQIDEDKYRTAIYSYMKFQYSEIIYTLENIKLKVIDYLINGYIIKTNLIFNNIWHEINEIYNNIKRKQELQKEKEDILINFSEL